LYTSAPSKIATGHIQAHIPCDATRVSPLKVIGGMMIMPEEVPPLNMTLDPAMSTPGMICICIILIFLLPHFNIIPTISSFIPNKMQ
jgi:hypothetical protein